MVQAWGPPPPFRAQNGQTKLEKIVIDYLEILLCGQFLCYFHPGVCCHLKIFVGRCGRVVQMFVRLHGLRQLLLKPLHLPLWLKKQGAE